MRFPGEWERHKATWVFWPTRAARYPYGSASDFTLVQRTFLRLVDVLSAFEPVRVGVDPSGVEEAAALIGKRAEVYPLPLDDAWARDAAPTFLAGGNESVAVCWKFTGWGGRFGPIEKDARAAEQIAGFEEARVRKPEFAMEGGGILSDGKGVVLTTAAVLRDTGRSGTDGVADRESRLAEILESDSIWELPCGFDGDDTGGHVDVVAAFAEDGSVLLNTCRDPGDPNRGGTERNGRYVEEKGREVVSVPQPEARFSRRDRLPYSYLNFYPANDCLLVPQFGDPRDEAALAGIAERFPNRETVAFDARPFYLGGGGIHCVTQPVF